MMRRRTLIIALLPLALAGCETPPVSGTIDSGVRSLSVGMTYPQIAAILGPHQAGEIGAETCLSWVYDETLDAKFIHARFADDRLISARDGFQATCDA